MRDKQKDEDFLYRPFRGYCFTCLKRLPSGDRGRPRVFCDDECKRAWHRAKTSFEKWSRDNVLGYGIDKKGLYSIVRNPKRRGKSEWGHSPGDNYRGKIPKDYKYLDPRYVMELYVKDLRFNPKTAKYLRS